MASPAPTAGDELHEVVNPGFRPVELDPFRNAQRLFF
jgi:hypothetical protein